MDNCLHVFPVGIVFVIVIAVFGFFLWRKNRNANK